MSNNQPYAGVFESTTAAGLSKGIAAYLHLSEEDFFQQQCMPHINFNLDEMPQPDLVIARDITNARNEEKKSTKKKSSKNSTLDDYVVRLPPLSRTPQKADSLSAALAAAPESLETLDSPVMINERFYPSISSVVHISDIHVAQGRTLGDEIIHLFHQGNFIYSGSTILNLETSDSTPVTIEPDGISKINLIGMCDDPSLGVTHESFLLAIAAVEAYDVGNSDQARLEEIRNNVSSYIINKHMLCDCSYSSQPDMCYSNILLQWANSDKSMSGDMD